MLSCARISENPHTDTHKHSVRQCRIVRQNPCLMEVICRNGFVKKNIVFNSYVRKDIPQDFEGATLVTRSFSSRLRLVLDFLVTHIGTFKIVLESPPSHSSYEQYVYYNFLIFFLLLILIFKQTFFHLQPRFAHQYLFFSLMS